MPFSFDPYSAEVDADPFPFYRALRDEHPCFWSEQAGMWVLSRYDDIVRAGQDWQTYSSANGNMMTELPGRAGATLGTTDPPRHDRLRGLIQKAFTRRNLEGLAEPIREDRAHGGAGPAGPARVRLHRGFLLEIHGAGAVRGARPAARGRADRARQGGADGAERPRHPRQGPGAHRRLRMGARLRRRGSSPIRRANPANDLISHFTHAEIDGDKLDDREVLLTTTTLIMAGIESLGGFMSMFALNLADFGDGAARLRRRPRT